MAFALLIFRGSLDFKVEMNYLITTANKMQLDIILYGDFKVQNVVCRSSDDIDFLDFYSQFNSFYRDPVTLFDIRKVYKTDYPEWAVNAS